MDCGKYHDLFDSLSLEVKENQEFLKFISIGSEHKNLKILEMLLNLEKEYPGMFIKVMENFDDVKAYRQSLDENGRPIRLSWEDALKKYYLNNKYIGITKENADIAKLFGNKGISQEAFDKASELRKNANINSIPEHILGKAIKEDTILESIEKIKRKTEDELINGKDMIEELYKKQFTYEWLSKNDPHNSILGVFCSCCGTITSHFYGKAIAISSVIAQDVQNLVVRNLKGEIISKGTMYVNKDNGYAVINDFELNENYRQHEGKIGIYNVDERSKDEQERQLIFSAFQRGVQAFIEEYDKQNPKAPLKQVNIGMGYNRLKKQVWNLKKSESNLYVPKEYGFQDAKDEQYILYKKTKKVVENKQYER